MVKCNHKFKYFYQKDSLGNTHLIIVCTICDRLKANKAFRPLDEADSVDYDIKWRISKAQRKRESNLNKTSLF